MKVQKVRAKSYEIPESMRRNPGAEFCSVSLRLLEIYTVTMRLLEIYTVTTRLLEIYTETTRLLEIPAVSLRLLEVLSRSLFTFGGDSQTIDKNQSEMLDLHQAF